MSTNYRLALSVLQKWTAIPPGREFMDFGLRLRELAQRAFPDKEMFPGTEADNLSKLNSLLRIVDNKYGKEYNTLKFGSLGLEKEDFEQLFEKENFSQIAQVVKSKG